jgi:hypothetical protein
LPSGATSNRNFSLLELEATVVDSEICVKAADMETRVKAAFRARGRCFETSNGWQPARRTWLRVVAIRSQYD